MRDAFDNRRPLAAIVAILMLIAGTVAIAQTSGGTGGTAGSGAAAGPTGAPLPGQGTGSSSGLPPPAAAGSSGRPATTGRGNISRDSTLPGCPPGSAASGTPRIINDPALGAGQNAPGC
jgi:hypothetical protein